MPSVQWVEPSPLWDGPPATFTQPWLAESKHDSFIADFLALMRGQVPGQTPADLASWQPELTDGALKLYQPLHQRYYLITGSLVCRQLGLPDRGVDRTHGEKTSFVLRRMDTQQGEQSWVPGTGWTSVPLAGQTVVDGEERLPLHRVAVCPGPVRTSPARPQPSAPSCTGRVVYYGYVPVASREKYLPRVQDPLATLGNVQIDPGKQPEDDVRLGEVLARVVGPWHDLLENPLPPPPSGPPPPIDLYKGSLYLLLDLGEFLKRVLPTVFDAIRSGDPSQLGTDGKALYDDLTKIQVGTVNPTGHITLKDALKELEPFFPMTQGQPAPTSSTFPHTYDMTSLPGSPPADGNYPFYLDPDPTEPPGHCQFRILLRKAITEAGTAPQVPDEVADMIREDPPSGDQFVLRLVYERPGCDPVVSPKSVTFSLAKVFDPDAPARHIHVELPSIENLRKFKRGIGMETTPALRSLMNQVNKRMLQGNGLSPGADWDLGMICSFSIPIITLVAFIVMFIFLIALNFIFWWLPFLKICFPIPVKKSA